MPDRPVLFRREINKFLTIGTVLVLDGGIRKLYSMSFTKTPLEKRRAVSNRLDGRLGLALAAFTWTTPEYGYRTNLADLAPGSS